MVCLGTHSIRLGDKTYPILRVECWWVVDNLGLFPNLADALEKSSVVSPAPVAVAENGIYEVLPPVMEKQTSESRNHSG
jgi:hypothetical protein